MANKNGNPNFHAIRNKDTAAANRVRLKNADDFAKSLAPLMLELASRGLTRNAIAKELNSLGKLTSRQKPWSAMAVDRYFKRIKAMYVEGVRLDPLSDA